MKTPSFLIVADRGKMHAFQVDNSSSREVPRLIDSTDFTEGKEPLREQYTDRLGGFPKGDSNGQGNGVTERMDLVAELEMRSFRQVAERITTLLREHRPQTWAFAAPSEINGAILDGLDPDLKASLKQNLPKDLTNVPNDQLIAHFQRENS